MWGGGGDQPICLARATFSFRIVRILFRTMVEHSAALAFTFHNIQRNKQFWEFHTSEYTLYFVSSKIYFCARGDDNILSF